MKINYINNKYEVTVEDHDVEKVKAEAEYTGKGFALAGWIVARHYAMPGTEKFSSVKHALLRACGLRGGKKAAKIKRTAVKETQQLKLF